MNSFGPIPVLALLGLVALAIGGESSEAEPVCSNDHNKVDLGDIKIRFAHIYRSPRHHTLDDVQKYIRNVAYDLRKGGMIKDAAPCMAEQIEGMHDLVFVPVPDSRGDTSANKALATAIAYITGGQMCDVLRRSKMVPSSRKRRLRGVSSLPVWGHQMHITAPCPPGNIIMVDNVATTGNTLRAARQAIGHPAIGLVWAADLDEMLT